MEGNVEYPHFLNGSQDTTWARIDQSHFGVNLWT